jgi:hypothetical protein
MYVSKGPYRDSSLLACDAVMGHVVKGISVGHSAVEMCTSVHLITVSHRRTLESSSLVALVLKSTLI